MYNRFNLFLRLMTLLQIFLRCCTLSAWTVHTWLRLVSNGRPRYSCLTGRCRWMLWCRHSDYTEWMPSCPFLCVKICNTSLICIQLPLDHYFSLLDQHSAPLLPCSSPPPPLSTLPNLLIPIFLLSMHLTYCSFPSIFCGLSNEGLTNNPIHAFDNASDNRREDDVLTRVDRYLLMACADVMEYIAYLTLYPCLPSVHPFRNQDISFLTLSSSPSLLACL